MKGFSSGVGECGLGLDPDGLGSSDKRRGSGLNSGDTHVQWCAEEEEPEGAVKEFGEV